MNDVLNAFLETVKERLSSSFFGPFLFSWMVFNYEIVLVLLFGDGAQPRINMVRDLLYVENSIDWNSLVCFPAGASIAYVILFPAFNWLAAAVREWWNNQIEAVTLYVQRRRPVPQDKIFELYDAFNKKLSDDAEKMIQYREAFSKYTAKTRVGLDAYKGAVREIVMQNLPQIMERYVSKNSVEYKKVEFSTSFGWGNSAAQVPIPLIWSEKLRALPDGMRFSEADALEKFAGRDALVILEAMGVLAVSISDEGVFYQNERSTLVSRLVEFGD